MAKSLTAAVAMVLICAPATALPADWLQFGYDQAHSGNNPDESSIDAENVKYLRPLYSLELGSAAAPVYLSGVPGPDGPRDVLFVTLTNGHLTALDAATGAVIWSRQPADAAWHTTEAAPAIDPSRNFVYGYGLDGKVHKYAVGDGTETIDGNWPIVSTLKPEVEHGSAALTIGHAASGTWYLYAVTNGFNGDGGDYQGHVTAINLATADAKVFNANCSNLAIHFVENGTFGVNDCATPRSGIWGRPGTIFDSATDRIYITTANGNFNANVGGYNWGDSVLALKPDASSDGLGNPADSYTPANFYELDMYDVDLGSGALAIVPAPAASKFQHLGAVVGKDAVVRLLNLDDMSGQNGPRFVGGELQALSAGGWIDAPTPQTAVWVDVHGDGSTWLFTAPPLSGVTGLQLVVDATGTPSLVTRWSVNLSFSSSPIVANDVLFAGDPPRALDPRTGAILWNPPSDTTSYSTSWGQPILVNGRLYVSGTYLTVFSLPPDPIYSDGFEQAK